MSVFYDLSKTPRNILNQAIVRAIVSENNGALFDPSDLSTLYQDAAGTIPVTAVEQPVGLMLDKARWMMLGPELVSNGTFDSGISGWVAPNGGWSWDASGKAKINGDGTGQTFLMSPTTLTAGKFYKVTVDLSITGGTLGIFTGADVLIASGSSGKLTAYFYASTTFYFKRSSGILTGTIDNVSIKELYGYHATQSITASRPTLSARKNILLATETLATQSVTTLAATYTLSFTGTGSVTLSGTATGTLTGTGTDRVSLTFTPTAGTLTLTVSGSVTKAQLGLGSVVTSYQRVTTATDYDVSAHYYYLRFDGVDDYLNLPYMGLYANGSASVVMGISRAKTGAVKYAITEGSPAGGKNYIPFRLSDTGVSSRIINDAGTVVVLTPESAGSASSLPEILSFKDTGNTLTLHKNSSQTNLTNYTRAGSLTLNNLTVGAIIQASVTENMLANLYSLIITKSALTDAQRIKCERYAASKAGVIL